METRKVTFQAHGKQIVCQTPLMKWAMQNRACRPDKVATHYVKQVIIHFVGKVLAAVLIWMPRLLQLQDAVFNASHADC
ncbi:hypothetical protein Y1Q_0009392 [Alligator mississippiensis]|uniref:Uncharacterized protein n=1 Tax=Alligator mississippiensis TaxID=8496 RepID=A0A151N7L3_ALLMI|nr:hypothetical protein Y1Q_0009392 [Alligator mississippiensis]